MTKKKIRLIIAGSRELTDKTLIGKAINFARLDISSIKEVVSGGARGIDRFGEWWAADHNIKCKKFPADWDNTDAPNARIRTRSDGSTYNAAAGFDRNKKMAEYGDVLLAITNGSNGTANMIENMQKLGKQIYVYEIDPPAESLHEQEATQNTDYVPF